MASQLLEGVSRFGRGKVLVEIGFSLSTVKSDQRQ